MTETPRCATSVRIHGWLVVSNVHLCGGRFDDPSYESLVHAKTEQIRALVEDVDPALLSGRRKPAFAPDIIVGDFNGERSLVAAKKTLGDYPLYRKLSDQKKELFLEFYRSVHDYLLGHGYAPLYTEELVGRTNRFGGVSDWIYVKFDLIVGVETVTSVNALQCSDHIQPLFSLR